MAQWHFYFNFGVRGVSPETDGKDVMTSCWMFADHTTSDSSREAGGLIRSGDGNDLVFSTSEPRAPIIAYKSYHHRPQVKTINHSTQLIIQINRQGIICTSSTVIENNAASASIQFESGSR